MIFLSIGLPGRFAEWCNIVIARLAGYLEGPVESRAWPPLAEMLGYTAISSTLDEAALALIETGAAHIVMGARRPDERLLIVLAEMKTRFVLALEDPRIAVADIMGETNAELRAVTRAVANSCPLVMRYRSLPGALTLYADQVKDDPAAAALVIADHFEIPVSAAEIREILKDLEASYGGPARDGGDNRAALVAATEHKMVDGALAGYRDCFAGGSLSEILWTRDFFIFDGQASGVAGLADLSGTTCVRPFIYGPYIHVPPGSWTARVVLGLSQEAARYRFRLDAFSGVPLALTSIQPEGGGIYTAQVEFAVGEPNGQGVEVRVWVDTDNARGQVAFGNVTLRPLAIRQPDLGVGSRSDFRAVLDV